MENLKVENRIREALKLRRMKQVELREKTGITKSAMSHWLAQRWQPKQQALMKMAQVLNVSELWLAGYDADIERPAEQIRIDKLAKHIHRLKNDDDLLDLSISLSELNSDQLAIIQTLIAQFKG